MRLRHKPRSGQTPKPTVFPSYLATSWKRQFGRCSCCYTNGVNIVCGFLKKLLYLRQLFSDFSRHQNLLQIWLKHKLLVSLPVSGSVWFWWGCRVCFSNKLPRDPHAAGPRTTLWELLTYGSGSPTWLRIKITLAGGALRISVTNLHPRPITSDFLLGVGGTKASVLFVCFNSPGYSNVQASLRVCETVVEWVAWLICGMQEGCCSYSYRIGRGRGTGVLFIFLAVVEDFLGGETHSKSTNGKVNQGSLHSVMFSVSYSMSKIIC